MYVRLENQLPEKCKKILEKCKKNYQKSEIFVFRVEEEERMKIANLF